MTRRARLFAKTGPFAGQSFPIGEEATFGRGPDNAVVLADAAVSGRHGRIFWDPEEECYRIEDLGSRNGTWVAGIRVREPEKLGPLDVIGVAGVGDLVFQVLEGDRSFETDLDLAAGDLVPPDLEGAAAGAEDSGPPEAAGAAGRTFADAEPLAVPEGIEAAGPPPPAEAFFLEVETAGAGTVRYLLEAGEHVVGRGSDADVVVESPTLSRAHARLVVDDEGVRVIDLESTNGTRVAGGEVAPGVPVALAPGTELELGSVSCSIVRAPVDTPEDGGS